MLRFILILTVALTLIQSFCASLRISYSTSDSVVVKHIYYNTNDSDSFNYVIHDKTLNLTCEADEPIEWGYSGSGSPSKVVETSRRVENTIVSQLKFEISSNKSRDYSQHTGNYYCRSLQNSTNQVSLYIYFPGKADKLFLHGSDSSPESKPEILYLPECTESSDKEKCHLLNRDFAIPCLPTDPLVNVRLFRATSNGTLELVDDTVFNQRFGFLSNSSNSSFSPGQYTCIAQTVGQENRTFLLYPSKSVKPTPVESNLYVGKVLNLTCEFHEPVLIKETASYLHSYDEDVSEVAEDEIEETTETIPLNKHVANYIDANPIPGSYGEFQCLTDNEAKTILHSWKYFVIGKEADEKSGIKYSKSKKSFKCRSKTNQPGLLSYVHCENPSECAINRNCLQKSNNCRGYKSPVLQKTHNHCRTTNKLCNEFLHFGGSGFVRCTGDGIDQIKKFSQFGLKKGNSSNNTTIADKPSLNITLNSGFENGRRTFKAFLKRSSSHFINGVKWMLKFYNENIQNQNDDEKFSHLLIEPESEREVEANLMEYQFKTLIAFNPIELSCKIPVRNSMNWTVLTIPFPKIPTLNHVLESTLDTQQLDYVDVMGDMMGTTVTSENS